MPMADVAADIFLHVQARRAGKIKGESTTDGHQGDIGVHGWSWGVEASTAIGSGASTARRSYRQLVVTKGIDSASTGLLAALVTNDEVREATLAMRKAGGEALDYFRMTLGGARVVGVDVDVGADGRALERVTFAFTTIDIEYKRQKSEGSGSGSMSFHDEVLPAR
jgi:type VI secretion system secreted protein Hcp